MQWEVSGADRATGEEIVLMLEADDEPSAIRRASRRGLVVERAHPVQLAGATAAAAPVGTDSVGFAYAAPTSGRRSRVKPRKRKASNGYGIAIVIALVVAGGVALAVVKSGVLGDGSGAQSQPGTDTAAAPVAPPPVSEPASTVVALPTISVTADVLIRAYANDPTAANRDYTGRMVSVTGEVETAGKGLFGTTCIGLKRTGAPAGGVRVQCSFAEGAASPLDTVHRGDNVTIVGRCGGMDGDIEVANSRLVP
jgi:hypothetical protein